MSKIQDPRIAKLPLWAQDYIRDIQRQRDAALETLNVFTESQKKSRIWTYDNPCIGEGTSPVEKRNYLQSYAVTFEFSERNVLEISFDHQYRNAIDIRASRELIFRPWAANAMRIIDPKKVED